MNLIQETVDTFAVGYGGADAVDRPIVDPGYAQKAFKGIRIRAATANTIVIYVGPRGVTTTSGYPLPAGEEVSIPIENPSKVYVTATPAANAQQTVALAGQSVGNTFTLTFRGQTTAPIAVNANAATVQAALRLLSTIGNSGCTVADTGGGPPYTVTFTGALAKTDVDLMTAPAPGLNETQNVTVTNAIANDKLVLTYDGDSTSELAYNATSAQIQAALEGLASVGADNVGVTDGATGWDVEFIGDLEKSDVGAITGVCGENEKQTLTYLQVPAAGDMLTLTYDGNSAAPIAYNSTSAQVKTALESIAALTGKVLVTDGNPGYVIEFIGALAGTDVDYVSATCGKNEQQTITVTGGAAGDKMILTLGADSTPELAYDITGVNLQTALRALASIGAGNCTVTGDGPYLVEFIDGKIRTDMAAITGVAGKNEKQTVAIDDASNGGTFTLTLGADTTTAIDYNATAGDVEDALELLPGIGAGNVAVTGGAGPAVDWIVEFKGTLAKTDVALMTGDGLLLTGGSTDVTITETVKGNLATIGVVESVKGHGVGTSTVETLKGNTATVTVTEAPKGDADLAVTIAKVGDITTGSKFSWIVV